MALLAIYLYRMVSTHTRENKVGTFLGIRYTAFICEFSASLRTYIY